MSLRVAAAGAGLCASALFAACAPAARSTARPDAEFLLVTDDSTAWVRTAADTVVVQRAPLLLTMLGGRLVELFVAEEPFDFEDATFLVSRVYRRDLVTGDSTLVFADSTVLREAMRYIRAHPDAERLEAEEPAAPGASALESGITPTGVIGTMLGVEVHVDRTVGELATHDTYAATLDLESGRRQALSDVIAPADAAAAMTLAHQSFGASVVLAGRRAGPVGKAASRALSALILDSLSFTLTRTGDSLAARFLAHDEQVIDEARDTHRFSLEPVALTPPGWWSQARVTLPRLLPDSSERFELGRVTLDVRYDSTDVATIATRTSTGQRPVTRMLGPVRQVIVLGDSLVRPPGQWRQALERAFSESGYYSEQVRAASLRGRARPTAIRQAAL